VVGGGLGEGEIETVYNSCCETILRVQIVHGSSFGAGAAVLEEKFARAALQDASARVLQVEWWMS